MNETLISGGTFFGYPFMTFVPIVSGFGPRADPFHPGQIENHNGVDMGGVPGTPALAMISGKCSASAFDPDLNGNYVRIDSDDGIWQIGYAHFERCNVAFGEYVNKGHIVGFVGSTGHSTAPHLHLTIRKNGQAIDPAPILNALKGL